MWLGLFFVYVDTVYGSYGYFLCLVGCFSMITWTPTVLSVLYACVSYFCICTCSAQLSMFHMEMRSRYTLIIIIINCTCSHTETAVADQAGYVIQSQYTAKDKQEIELTV